MYYVYLLLILMQGDVFFMDEIRYILDKETIRAMYRIASNNKSKRKKRSRSKLRKYKDSNCKNNED